MPAEEWTQLYEWLNQFQIRIENSSLPHLRCLCVDFVDDEIIVAGVAPTFYRLQQILTAVRAVIDEHQPNRAVLLSIAVRDRTLEFPVYVATAATAVIEWCWHAPNTIPAGWRPAACAQPTPYGDTCSAELCWSSSTAYVRIIHEF